MDESWGSQVFTTNNGIQSGPYAFEESRLAMVVTVLAVTLILSLYYVLNYFQQERKTKRYLCNQDQRNLRKYFSKYHCLVQCRRKHLRQSRYSRFIYLENTISDSTKNPKIQVSGKRQILCFICPSQFDSFKDPFERTFLDCLNLALDTELKTKKTNEA